VIVRSNGRGVGEQEFLMQVPGTEALIEQGHRVGIGPLIDPEVATQLGNFRTGGL